MWCVSGARAFGAAADGAVCQRGKHVSTQLLSVRLEAALLHTAGVVQHEPVAFRKSLVRRNTALK